MEILLISLTFLVLLLLVVWRPFFRQAKKNKREEKAVVNNSQLRHETNIGLYREHKKEIEKDYSEGGID